MGSLLPRDALGYWLSHRGCNDLFLLYCFGETERSTAWLRAWIAERSARIPELRVRLRERRFGYPAWVPAGFTEDRVLEHAAPTWPVAVAAIGELLDRGVRAQESPWRVHLFRNVSGAPGVDGPGLIVVLQLSHALVDGRGAAAIARALFSESVPHPAAGSGDRAIPFRRTGHMLARLSAEIAAESFALSMMPIRVIHTVIRGFGEERARRELAARTARGELPPPPPAHPPTALNRAPAPAAHAAAMLVRTDLRVPGHTVTVVAATAVSLALSRYLSARGSAPAELAAQVPLALPGRKGSPRNNYRDLSIELHTAEPDLRRRADRIAATLDARRARARHPLQFASDRVTAVLPAPMLRHDIACYPTDVVPGALSGHTVVSSVDRGPADLSFAGAPVHFTAGFPALGAVMHLTHGVHGLGDTVTVSVHADPAVVDVEDYAAQLDTALSEVVAALRA
ncbi:DUF1298 domain-containing protein [Nocardia terpenica]|uniref:WS/DGAT domain-containing protein n=1 Tax=Nocardia terpenica TaxID=455432 RepID=UPI00189387B5|nr:WS/DGAT domain-containing protein [Nocardia terpenica]MBF6064994.1 DUF1298 domain-containing protein [Nocardia terpenica]MBF6115266.1 DUF1298 domain-containing protein [Nocardia terpenica]MBF6122588.1 DUF1298 domain-containing protein [Nocardia terpenica]